MSRHRDQKIETALQFLGFLALPPCHPSAYYLSSSSPLQFNHSAVEIGGGKGGVQSSVSEEGGVSPPPPSALWPFVEANIQF